MRPHCLRNLTVLASTPLALVMLLLLACGAAATATPPPPTPTAPAGAPGMPTATPTDATQPEAATPVGRLTLAWHTGISSAWLDPQENLSIITPYNFQYALHDAAIKVLPGDSPPDSFTNALAESWEMAEDFRSIVLRVREGATFHNGAPVTAEDVRFTYENYRGAQAEVFHNATTSIDLVDERTLRFNFGEPFLDFMLLYGTPASGAGWVVPAAYYQQEGADRFKVSPVGAGPFRLTRQDPGNLLEFEAFTDYWRRVPAARELVMRSIPEGSTRVAALQGNEVDIIYLVPGELVDTVVRNQQLRLTPVYAAPFYLVFPNFDQPDNPFNDIRVRQAVSLTLDRQALSEAEHGGLADLTKGNFIQHDWPGSIEWPAWEYDLQRARDLMAEAGFPNGFEAQWLSPVPPYFSWGERILTQLQALGIRARLQTMERGTFLDRQAAGRSEWPGVQIVMTAFGGPGSAAARLAATTLCDEGSSLICVPEIDALWQQYEVSQDPEERQEFVAEMQRMVLENYYHVVIYPLPFINAIGPRVLNDENEIMGSIPQFVYAGPWEDIRVQE